MPPFSVSALRLRLGLARAEVTNEFLYQSAARRSLEQHLAWNSTFKTLRDWALSPIQPPDEEFTPPSSDVIGRASWVAERLRDQSWTAPSFTVPDGDGGLAFEWRLGSTTYSLGVERSGPVQLLCYDEGRLRDQRDLTWLASVPALSTPGSQGFLTTDYDRVAR